MGRLDRPVEKICAVLVLEDGLDATACWRPIKKFEDASRKPQSPEVKTVNMGAGPRCLHTVSL
jgi:hypothetical protein